MAPIPHNLVYLDTEGTESKHPEFSHVSLYHFKLACSQLWQFTKDGYRFRTATRHPSPQHFWDYFLSLLSPKRITWLLAHNLAWDLTQIDFWEMARSKKILIDNYIIEDPPTIIWCDSMCGGFSIVDTFNYWRCSVDKMGQDIGIPKFEKPSEATSDDDWFNYCQRDVDIIARTHTSFCNTMLRDYRCPIKETAASQAWEIWHRHFAPVDICPHHNADIEAVERASYLGAKCEPKYIGEVKGDVYILDVNSLYPYVMRDTKMPVEFLEHVKHFSLSDLRCIPSDRYVIADARIHADPVPIPIKTTRGIVYARGIFRQWFHEAELNLAASLGMSPTIHSALVYRAKPIFSEFVEHFFCKKLDAKRNDIKTEQVIDKTILNSLHAKYGQRKRSWVPSRKVKAKKPYGYWWSWNDEKDKYDIYRSMGWRVQESIPGGTSKHSLLAIPGAVTSLARCYVYELERIAGRQNVYYVDNDELHVNAQGYWRLSRAGLIHQDSLGKLKIKSHHSYMVYRGYKNYDADGTHVVCGLSKRADTVSDTTFLQDSFQSIEGMLASDPSSICVVRKTRFTLRSDFKRGILRRDGWIEPFYFSGYQELTEDEKRICLYMVQEGEEREGSLRHQAAEGRCFRVLMPSVPD